MRLVQNLLALGAATSALAAPTSLLKRQTTLDGKNLSILPLGDSITVSMTSRRNAPRIPIITKLTITPPKYGIGSASSNSYREFLQTSLSSAGATVDYVGTVQSGTMSDKDNEGHPGWTINQIADAASSAAGAGIQADVVLVHAGTNDAGTYGWEEAHVRLGSLIDVVTSKWPEAAVLVAKIIPSSNANTQSNINFLNERVQGT